MANYTSVDEIILNLPKHEQAIVKKLRSLVLDCLPKSEEKLTYGAPFYTRNRMICFIWPPSITWGVQTKAGKHADKGVSFGFCQGHLMANKDGALLKENRKQVYCLYFKTLSEINEQQIRALLFEADLIDQTFSKKKKAKI
jgi:Domain of unknown function (DU1801)